MEPIWTLSTTVATPIFLLIAAVLFMSGLWLVGHYVKDKKTKSSRFQEKLEHHQRWTKFKSEYIDRINEERQAKIKAKATAAGQNWKSYVYDMGLPTETYQYVDYLDIHELREAYEEQYEGANSYRDEDYPRANEFEPESEEIGFGITGMVAGLALAGLVAWAMYPWQSVYHQYRTVQGVVTKAEGQKVNGTDSGDLYISYVFDIAGKKYVCEEARCGSIHEGDTAKLRCKPSYQRVGAPINECKFVSVREA